MGWGGACREPVSLLRVRIGGPLPPVPGSPPEGMDERQPAALSREINGKAGDGENGPYVSDR